MPPEEPVDKSPATDLQNEVAGDATPVDQPDDTQGTAEETKSAADLGKGPSSAAELKRTEIMLRSRSLKERLRAYDKLVPLGVNGLRLLPDVVTRLLDARDSPEQFRAFDCLDNAFKMLTDKAQAAAFDTAVTALVTDCGRLQEIMKARIGGSISVWKTCLESIGADDSLFQNLSLLEDSLARSTAPDPTELKVAEVVAKLDKSRAAVEQAKSEFAVEAQATLKSLPAVFNSPQEGALLVVSVAAALEFLPDSSEVTEPLRSWFRAAIKSFHEFTHDNYIENRRLVRGLNKIRKYLGLAFRLRDENGNWQRVSLTCTNPHRTGGRGYFAAIPTRSGASPLQTGYILPPVEAWQPSEK